MEFINPVNGSDLPDLVHDLNLFVRHVVCDNNDTSQGSVFYPKLDYNR